MSKKEHNKPGYWENPDHTGKAPKHRMAALREQYKDTLRQGIVPSEIITKTQAKRTESAKRQDSQKTADIVLEQGIPEDVLQWSHNPEKYDLRGVDDKHVEKSTSVEKMSYEEYKEKLLKAQKAYSDSVDAYITVDYSGADPESMKEDFEFLGRVERKRLEAILKVVKPSELDKFALILPGEMPNREAKVLEVRTGRPIDVTNPSGYRSVDLAVRAREKFYKKHLRSLR